MSWVFILIRMTIFAGTNYLRSSSSLWRCILALSFTIVLHCTLSPFPLVTEVGQRAAVAVFKGFKEGSVFYELLLTKEKFYKGGLCLPEDRYRSSGMDCAPVPWIVLSYHGSRSRPSPSGLASGRWHRCVRDTPVFMLFFMGSIPIAPFLVFLCAFCSVFL